VPWKLGAGLKDRSRRSSKNASIKSRISIKLYLSSCLLYEPLGIENVGVYSSLQRVEILPIDAVDNLLPAKWVLAEAW